MLLSAACQIVGGVFVLTLGGVVPGVTMLLIGSLFAWLAYTNFMDAAACAALDANK